jgi:hypothetical protein
MPGGLIEIVFGQTIVMEEKKEMERAGPPAARPY